MDWIDQNLDAYRVIAEILTDLRPLVRERLEAAHGKDWFRDGIPDTILERLIENKEQEASIDWYENRYQEVISYAVFPDLFDILVANPGVFTPIMKLAPSTSLLNTRFLELEVMRSKIGRGRRISEAEINFLTSFHLRFRKAIQELRADDSTPELEQPPADVQDVDLEEPSFEIEAPEPVAPAEPEEPAPQAPPTEAPPATPSRPPMRKAATPADATPVPEPTAAAEVPEPTDEAESEEAETPKRETPVAAVKRALEAGDDQGILRELYREVTGIAEVIWTTTEIPTTSIWDRVSVTSWYESSFSRLNLRPLSDFYELISQVRRKRQTGAGKADVQSFLNDSKFATILLALRDMFQQNSI